LYIWRRTGQTTCLGRQTIPHRAGRSAGVPTDCPQRAERQGWLNDQTARAEQLVHNFDARRFLAKWLDDMADAQDPATGAISETVPSRFGNRCADPVCVCPVLYPWLMWRHWGDRAVLERHWGMMAAWQRCIAATVVDGVVGYSWWGDWCPPAAFGMEGDACHARGMPGGLVSTAHLVYMTRLLACIAGELGHAAEEVCLLAQADALAAAIHRRWYDVRSASYGTNVQACNALALWTNVVPEDRRAEVFAALVTDCAARGHLSTGNICTKYVLEALADGGRADLAWRLITRRDYPSWGHMLDHGATALWERWELETGSGMNSHNHSMLGAVDAWFYTRLAGLRDDAEAEPGERYMCAPQPVPGLDRASAGLDTRRGRLALSWRRTGDGLVVDLEVPALSCAIFVVPRGWAGAGQRRPLGGGVHQIRLSPAHGHELAQATFSGIQKLYLTSMETTCAI
jgi:alpha-L-rhamnosidase